MSNTNPKDFKMFLELLPKELFEYTWFFPLRPSKKNPDCPSGTILKGNLSYRLHPKEAYTRLKWGKNVGIYALPKGLLFLDLDVENGKMLASQKYIDMISSIPTFTVQTRNGGIQKYFRNDGIYPNQLLYENGIKIGELRADWFYVVAVGSFVDIDEDNCNGDGTYRIVHPNPMVSFPGFENVHKYGETTLVEAKLFVESRKSISIEEYNNRLINSGKQRRKYEF